MRWLLERTGLNLLEQQQMPASLMRGYRQRYMAGLRVMRHPDGAELLARKGW